MYILVEMVLKLSERYNAEKETVITIFFFFARGLHVAGRVFWQCEV